QPAGPGAAGGEVKRVTESEARRKAVAEAAQRQAEVDAERRRQHEAAASAQRRADDAERLRRQEMDRIAAEEAARREAAAQEERRQADERVRIASLTLNADDRVAFVKRVQAVLKQGRCYEGAINGRAGETQDEVDRFVATTSKKGRSRPTHIELAKATASDFEAWLRDA